MDLRVRLSRKSWHYRLQQIMFGQVPYQKNLCPYFWLSVFCTLTAPFYFGGIWAGQILGTCLMLYMTALEKLGTTLDRKFCEPYAKRKVSAWSQIEIAQCFEKRCQRSKRYEKLYFIWKDYAGPDWFEKLHTAREQYEAVLKKQAALVEEQKAQERARKQAAQAARKEWEAQRAKLFCTIIRYTKPIGIVLISTLIIAVVLALIALVGWGVVELVKNINLVTIGIALFWIAVVAIVTMIPIALYLLVLKLAKCPFWGWPKINWSRHESAIQALLDTVDLMVWPFKALWRLLRAAVRFPIFFFKMVKANYCPAIDWDD